MNMTSIQMYIIVGMAVFGVLIITVLVKFIETLLKMPYDNAMKIAILEEKFQNLEKDIEEMKKSNEANFYDIKKMINKLLEKI